MPFHAWGLAPCLLFTFLLNSVVLCATKPVMALEVLDSRPGLFRVRQEHLDLGGVLVSRPRAEDRDILSFLRQNHITTLQDYARWLEQEIRYRRDPSGQDIWSDPLQTLKTREGDCEDIAILNAAVLRVLGFQPRLIALVRPSGGNHAVCVFDHNGTLAWFDNTRLQRSATPNLETLARQFVDLYGYTASLEFQTADARWRMLYQKS